MVTGRVSADMLVEIFSDVVCPWCAVGKRRFEAALGQFEHADEIDVVWRAYELDPHAPARRKGDYVDRLARKYGMTREQAVSANERLTAVAAAEGLDFHFERAQSGNTFDAHRLLHYARAAGPGRQDAFKERLFVAYFTEGAAIGEAEILVRLAAEVGLDPAECADILTGDRYADEVRADEREALELGVTGVPFFVVDGKFGIPGAQDADTILRVLQRAWTKAHHLEVAVVSGDDAVCEGERCAG
jgi:predicted DsbA family dithiol-disulfide isomerase